MGYNLLQANPEGDFNRGGVDPGIKTTRFVFKQTYSQGNNIFYQGRRMQVPDQVTFHQTHSCVQTHSTKAYSGQASYRKELSLNVEAAGKKFILAKHACMQFFLYMQPPTMDFYFQRGLHLAVVSASKTHALSVLYAYFVLSCIIRLVDNGITLLFRNAKSPSFDHNFPFSYCSGNKKL